MDTQQFINKLINNFPNRNWKFTILSGELEIRDVQLTEVSSLTAIFMDTQFNEELELTILVDLTSTPTNNAGRED